MKGLAAALGVTYTRITLRDQRSRWGSCSSRGTLSFNWRLVLAPHDVLDYVVVHEVCHLVELHRVNRSRASTAGYYPSPKSGMRCRGVWVLRNAMDASLTTSLPDRQ